jgi:hypothetical protein
MVSMQRAHVSSNLHAVAEVTMPWSVGGGNQGYVIGCSPWNVVRAVFVFLVATASLPSRSSTMDDISTTLNDHFTKS